jgi:RimJ/RimL family protein N-acetyltransferase
MTAAPRFALRSWTLHPADVDALFDMYSRADVRRYIGDGRVMRDRAEAVAMVERWQAGASGALGVWAIESPDDGLLGSILLKHIPWSADAAEPGTPEDIEIGWHLHPRAWGRGYATAAASAVLADAWAAGIPRVVAVTNPANAASQHVCARLGMRRLGRSTKYYDTECELFELARPTPVDSVLGPEPV